MIVVSAPLNQHLISQHRVYIGFIGLGFRIFPPPTKIDKTSHVFIKNPCGVFRSRTEPDRGPRKLQHVQRQLLRFAKFHHLAVDNIELGLKHAMGVVAEINESHLDFVCMP